MAKRVLAIALTTILILSVGLQVVEFADANPTWGTSATPIPPITDPPQIIINSPSSEVYSNPVPLNITIVQPNSWVTNRSMALPNSYDDNSDSVVVGQNKLKSITCIIDGNQPIILWNGTPVGQGFTYYLPQITQFSAEMNLNKGQHILQVNVEAVSEYVVEGIIPFAAKEYSISANQSTTFYLINGDPIGPQTIYNIKSSYEIWQSSSNFASLTSAPTQFLEPTSNPTVTPTVPELSWLALLPLCLTTLSVVWMLKRRKIV